MVAHRPAVATRWSILLADRFSSVCCDACQVSAKFATSSHKAKYRPIRYWSVDRLFQPTLWFIRWFGWLDVLGRGARYHVQPISVSWSGFSPMSSKPNFRLGSANWYETFWEKSANLFDRTRHPHLVNLFIGRPLQVTVHAKYTLYFILFILHLTRIGLALTTVLSFYHRPKLWILLYSARECSFPRLKTLFSEYRWRWAGKWDDKNGWGHTCSRRRNRKDPGKSSGEHRRH